MLIQIPATGRNTGESRDSQCNSQDPAEGPRSESSGQPRERHRGEHHGNAGGPVVYAENAIANRHQPINERSFFEISDPVQACGDPIARGQHVARDLRLHGVDVIHQRRRGDHAADVNGACKQENG